MVIKNVQFATFVYRSIPVFQYDNHHLSLCHCSWSTMQQQNGFILCWVMCANILWVMSIWCFRFSTQWLLSICCCWNEPPKMVDDTDMMTNTPSTNKIHVFIQITKNELLCVYRNFNKLLNCVTQRILWLLLNCWCKCLRICTLLFLSFFVVVVLFIQYL